MPRYIRFTDGFPYPIQAIQLSVMEAGVANETLLNSTGVLVRPHCSTVTTHRIPRDEESTESSAISQEQGLIDLILRAQRPAEQNALPEIRIRLLHDPRNVNRHTNKTLQATLWVAHPVVCLPYPPDRQCDARLEAAIGEPSPYLDDFLLHESPLYSHSWFVSPATLELRLVPKV